jgi:hypothetical protein
MTKREILITWLLSVVLGSLFCSLFAEFHLGVLLIFIVVSGATSLPYLITTILLLDKIKNVFSLLLIQALFAIISWLVIKVSISLIILIPLHFIILSYFIVGIVILWLNGIGSARRKVVS